MFRGAVSKSRIVDYMKNSICNLVKGQMIIDDEEVLIGLQYDHR